ncbi:condensin-2 complex subunit D3 [Hyalella azteca]|uniref:Condensin-2 complex subunit D3 n=1 Tax=Hyalella azteca TaxID=294128 RepID=A0A979FMG4_HYAAZ|nr:condensin-2 complex subunit D3 [Hyalella azteca]
MSSQVIDLFAKFSLEKLSRDWIDFVIDSDLTEIEDLPGSFEDEHVSTNFRGLFDAVISELRAWVDSLPVPVANEENRKSMSLADLSVSSEADEGERHTPSRFWVDLAQVAPIKSIMTFLFYHAHIGQRYNARESERELGCLAGSLYFLLLSVPGSNAFRIFHPILFLKTLDLMRLTTKLHIGAVTPRKGKGPKAPAGRRHADDPPVAGDEDDEEDTDITLLTQREANNLIRNLNFLLLDFLRLTVRFSLKHSPESIDETINILVDVTRSETHNAHSVFVGKPNEVSVTSLVYNSYVALQCLCAHLHGSIRKIVTLVLKHILPNILMVSRGTSDLSVRSLGVIRDHSVIFVRYLLTQIKEPSYEGVYILVQHLCLRVPDKADFRQKTSQSVVEILQNLPIKLYTKLMQWFFKFSHNEKAGHRLFTLEIISRMLAAEERHADDGQEAAASATPDITSAGASPATPARESNESTFNILPPDHSVNVPANRNILSHKFLLSIIFSRCRDSAATVRSKALALLAECTLSDNPTIMLAMKQIFQTNQPVVFTTPHVENNQFNLESPLEDIESSPNDKENEVSVDMPNAAMVLTLLTRRCRDDKVTVRKSALQVLENLTKLDNQMLTKANLQIFCDHCRDPALLIRKQMVVALTQLVEDHPQMAAEAWVMGVLPAILDPEMKVQEKVTEVKSSLSLILFLLLVNDHPESETHTNELPWLLLATVTRLSYHKFLSKAITVWGASALAKPGIIAVTKSHIGGEHNEQAWLLLSLLSHCLDVTDASFAVRYYRDNCQNVQEVGWCCLQGVLRVLCNSIKSIPALECAELQELLLQPVKDVAVGATLMPAILDLLVLINVKLHGEDQPGQDAMKVWVAPLLVSCDEHLQKILFSPQQQTPLSAHDEEQLFRRIFLLGEAGLLLPSAVNKRMFLMLQSIIFHGQHGTHGATSPPPGIPSSQIQSSQPLNLSYVPSARVKAVSVAVLGKLCLQHESQAKRIVPALGRLLDMQVGPDIKTNIIMRYYGFKRDHEVKYATVVDPLMPQMTACLRDPDLSVRRTTLTLVISLLQEDYLKLKGSFFYRILQCLCDDHEEIRDTVIFFLTERLLKRFPKIFLQHFIECIFHYNCYEEHESYNRFAQNQQEKELFSLAGPEHLAARMSIYKFMLEHMADDQRFSITQRLCHDVIGGVVDGRMGAAGSDDVLRDTLLVLCSDEIKLASLKSRPEEDHPVNQEEQAQIAGMAIKKTIISQVVKRNVIENIVPILIALKHKLEKQRSPLMKQLLLYFKEIMKDYKNEIKEILAGDKQLAEEIEFNLRQLEERQKEEEAAQRLAEQARLREETRLRGRLSTGVADRTSLPHLKECSAKEASSGTQSAAPSLESHSGFGNNLTMSKSPSALESNSPARAQDLSQLCADRTLQVAVERLSPKRIACIKENFLKNAVLNSQRLANKKSVAGNSTETEENLSNDSVQSPKIKAAFEKRRLNLEAETAAFVSSAREEMPAPHGPVHDDQVASTSGEARGRTSDDVESEASGEEASSDRRANPVNRNAPAASTQKEQQEAPRHDDNAEDGTAPTADAELREARRLELLRAISTPTRNQSVICNITFKNQTQNVSAIPENMSTLSEISEEPSNDQQGSILLHFKDPTAYAKDDQFSMIRKSTKRSLDNDFKKLRKTEADKDKRKASGGLFESVCSEGEVDGQEMEQSFRDSPGCRPEVLVTKTNKKRSNGKRKSNK